MKGRMSLSPHADPGVIGGRRDAFDARPSERVADMPEKRLMLAVLLDAIIQLRRPGSTGAIEATKWIRDDDPESPFSFLAVCEVLAIDPVYLSRGVFAWARTGRDAPSLAPTRLRRSQTRALRLSTRRRRRRAVAAL